MHLRQVRRRDVEPAEQGLPVVQADVDEELIQHVGDGTNHPLRQRDPSEEPLGARGEPEVQLRHHPDRRALVDRQVGGLLRQFGDQLHRRRAGADDRHAAPPLRIVGVVPVGGVDDLAGEAGDPRDVGHVRLRQEARRGDQVAGAQRVTVGQGHPPDLGLLVPASAFDRRVEPHVPAHVVLVGDVAGVLLDLVAGGEQPRPVRVRLEEVGVGGGGHVDRQAGVVVDVPGPAQVVLAVENDEVLVPPSV